MFSRTAIGLFLLYGLIPCQVSEHQSKMKNF